MEIQEKIRLMRNAKNWSQEEMANKLKMSINGYAKIEHGETDPQLSRLNQIAEIFEVDLLGLVNFGEKGVLCLIGSNYQNNNSGQGQVLYNSNAQHEIEKLKIEIKYLKEMLELVKDK